MIDGVRRARTPESRVFAAAGRASKLNSVAAERVAIYRAGREERSSGGPSVRRGRGRKK